MYGLCALAGLIVVLTLADVAYQLVNNASLSISHFGLGFLVHARWAPNFYIDGAGALIYGTLVTSLFALVLATPLGIAIGLYLSMMASPRLRAVIGPLIEMLAAVPSIIFGFWGLIVLVPFIQHIEPGLHSALGFIPLFGAAQPNGISLFAAGVVLTLMILPIISSLSRDLFLTVPQELRDGAAALGATRWEIIRGVVLPSTVSGLTAAVVLALGRALGEAIAVSLVIGGRTNISASLFQPGSTLASQIASQFPSPDNALHLSSMFYAGLVLLVIGLITSLAARALAGRFDVERSYARAVGV
jgi:phosphate transport system permease protein